MGTIPYVKAATTVTEYPLVTFARSIGKNTADMTGRDLKRFLKWLWVTEPYKHRRWQPKEHRHYFKGKLGDGHGHVHAHEHDNGHGHEKLREQKKRQRRGKESAARP